VPRLLTIRELSGKIAEHWDVMQEEVPTAQSAKRKQHVHRSAGLRHILDTPGSNGARVRRQSRRRSNRRKEAAGLRAKGLRRMSRRKPASATDVLFIAGAVNQRRQCETRPKATIPSATAI